MIMALLVAQPGLSTAQNIDAQHSKVRFKVSNLLIGSVKGTFQGMKGQVEFKPEDLEHSSLQACIQVNTINTGIDLRDKDLMSERFFDLDHFSEICFRSESIRSSDDGYVAEGKLTMHGVTKDVEIPFTVDGNVMSGSFTINRLDYNIGEGVGKFMAGKEVTVFIECQVNTPDSFSSD